MEVDLDRVGFNLNQIRKRVGVGILPCVKRNAYGHGIVPIVAYLNNRGVKRVLVAKLGEALQLRTAGLTSSVINIDPLYTPSQYDIVVKENITQTVFNKTTADGVDEAARRWGETVGVFIKIDTGLSGRR